MDENPTARFTVGLLVLASVHFTAGCHVRLDDDTPRSLSAFHHYTASHTYAENCRVYNNVRIQKKYDGAGEMWSLLLSPFNALEANVHLSLGVFSRLTWRFYKAQS